MKMLSQSEFDAVSQQRVETAIKACEKRLSDEDCSLLRLDAHERSICFRFALYLAEQFPEFDVDCEYNRNHAEDDYLKRLKDKNLFDIVGREPTFGDEDGLMIMPDIIVHIRDEPMNLLVIEAKKTSSLISEHIDLFKLQAIKEELGYRFARFIQFNVREDFDTHGISESFFI
jgi:hypothetical protein